MSSMVRCAACGHGVPACSLHCVYCGAEVATLVNLDGQLGLKLASNAIPCVVALTVGGEQVAIDTEDELVVEDPDPPRGRSFSVPVRSRVPGGPTSVRVGVGQVIEAVQNRVEVIDVP